MKFSIAICSYNRKDLLKSAIGKALGQVYAPVEFEVLVVDNMSSDGTWEMLERIEAERTKPPLLRILREEKKGLSHARNRAIAEAQGEWILFLDDDSLADPGLLGALDQFASDPQIGVIGGAIDVILPERRPVWLGGRLLVYWSQYSIAEAQTDITRPFDFPYGANFCVRREVFDGIGGFNVRLGRQGRDATGGEEVDICFRARAAGYRIAATPDAVVKHVVATDRFTISHCFRVARSTGRTWAFFETEYLQGDRHILKYLVYFGWNLALIFNILKKPVIPNSLFRITVAISKFTTLWNVLRQKRKMP